MVKVEIFEIEVLFCAYVCVTSYILMVGKAIKKACSIQNKPFFICMYRDYSPQFIASIRL
ncbi:hypothetical protein DW150_18980 [Phocaeicola vulgatus]|uniref:Uncharacterized protein n=1 Tax=Phocaeicola vulgatus TaxID=821 RepID=A0A415BJL3_PHOVU|nr:hypothetical protein DW150_18980 [Phocaeicola vulgatus]